MKKNILHLLTPLLFFMAVDAQAQKKWLHESTCPPEDATYGDKTNFYAKIFGGANFLQNTTIEDNQTSYNTGYVVAGSLGYSAHYGLHPEFEYAFRRNGIDKMKYYGDSSATQGHFLDSSYMANLLWYMPFWNTRPFIGGGIGYDFQQVYSSNSRIDFSQKWNRFSWQAMAGFAFPIFRNTELTLEYKFHQGGHFYNNALGIGIVYKFGYLK
jgi:opacity protein-like surface antigen